MIDNRNISAYIDYLHRLKKQSPAPEDLINKWKNLPQSEIYTQLNNLYRHWGLNENEGRKLEQNFEKENLSNQEFVDRIKKSQLNNDGIKSKDYYNQKSFESNSSHFNGEGINKSPYQGALPSRNKSGVQSLVWVLIAILAIIGTVFAAYYFNNNSNTNNIDNDASVTNGEVVESPLSDLIVSDTEGNNQNVDSGTYSQQREIENEIATRKMQLISLLSSEEERNLGHILDHFAPSVSRYWDIENPSKSQIMDRYYNTWSKTQDIQYKNVVIERIEKNVYDLSSDYSYYSIKEDIYKTLKTKTRYVFNDNGEIISAYGIK